MDAPLYQALCDLAGRHTLRMHMPGHKGRLTAPAFADAAALDFTELAPTGNLYTGLGPIAAAEALAARSFGAQRAYFLTGGSTQGVCAGLALCAAPGTKILLDRNSHRSFFAAMALLDLTPVYLPRPDAEAVAAALTAENGISAVAVTSPTYYGVIHDVTALARVCRARGVPLLVDEAHGAHLPALGLGPVAAGRGAAVSICSAHKTLPALGSSALVFTDGSFDDALVRSRTALFGTSSPSYPIMASIDWARAWLDGEGGVRYRAVAEQVSALRADIDRRGVFRTLRAHDGAPIDPCRLTVITAAAGLDGRRAAQCLENEYGVYCELADREQLVFILTCADSDADISRLAAALHALEQTAGGAPFAPRPPLPLPVCACSVRRAVLSPRHSVPLCRAVGCVCAESIAPYPPGIPVVAPGERIDEACLAYLSAVGYSPDAPVSVLS